MGKQVIKLEDVVLDATVTEKPTRKATVTNKPVEKGVDISDHMRQEPHTVKITGSMVDDAASKLQILKQYQKEARLLKYHGRNIFADVVLTNLTTDHSVDNAKGYHYDMTLQYVKISSPETFEINVKNPDTGEQDPKTATRVKKKTNVGRKQPKESTSSSGRGRQAQLLESASQLTGFKGISDRVRGNLKIGGNLYTGGGHGGGVR